MLSYTAEAREQRCRRALHEIDCSLHKSRARSWSFDNQCGYMIVDDRLNAVIAGPQYDLSLSDVEYFCNDVK